MRKAADKKGLFSQVLKANKRLEPVNFLIVIMLIWWATFRIFEIVLFVVEEFDRFSDHFSHIIVDDGYFGDNDHCFFLLVGWNFTTTVRISKMVYGLILPSGQNLVKEKVFVKSPDFANPSEKVNLLRKILYRNI